MFHRLSKHLEFRQKFDSLLGVWIPPSRNAVSWRGRLVTREFSRCIMGCKPCFVLFSRFPPSLFTWLEGKLKNVSILDIFTLPIRLILNGDNFKLQRTLKMVNTTGVRRGTRYMFSRDFRKRGKLNSFLSKKFITRLLYFDITLNFD